MVDEPVRLIDPTNEASPAAWRPAARPRSLAGQRIALLDIGKPRSEQFLDGLQPLLEARGNRIERFRKPTFTRTAPPDIRREIAARCDLVIAALAD